jgi:acetyl-CoA carboxylase carboxyltransferase component
MGSAQAGSVLLDIKLKQLQKEGKEFSEADKKKLEEQIKKAYDDSSSALYASARLWVDEIIDPAKTREYISMSLEVADHNPNMPKFNVGVIQT